MASSSLIPTLSCGPGVVSQGKLQDQLDKYAQANTSEKRVIQVMETQIQTLKSKVAQQRKVMGGVNAARDNQNMINKQYVSMLPQTMSRQGSERSGGLG